VCGGGDYDLDAWSSGGSVRGHPVRSGYAGRIEVGLERMQSVELDGVKEWLVDGLSPTEFETHFWCRFPN